LIFPDAEKPPDPAYDPNDPHGNEVIGIDGIPIGPWPKEYSPAFTLRLLNSDIQQPKERIAYNLFQREYPHLMKEVFKRRRILRANR
jgi:hypothetical protein